MLLVVLLAVAAPCGYLAGDVYTNKYKSSPEMTKALPILAACFPPLAAVLAIILIFDANKGE